TGVSSPNAQNASGSVVRNGDPASRAWDIAEILWDSHGNLNPEGRLPTDRPRVVKLYGSYTFQWGTEIAGNFYAGSGAPLSTYVWTINSIPLFVNGRGDLGRTERLSQTDMLISHEIKLGETRRVRFEANVLNLFNQKSQRHLFTSLNRPETRPSAQMDLSKVD